jgi:hypothetical protein
VKKFFEAISGVAIMAACILLRPLMWRWYATWGASGEEITMALPGDELVPQSRGGYTQAVSIRAPAGEVWPWIVQTGQDKAGFYSYQGLENLVGCHIRNVDRIVPEYQDIKVGDSLIMAPSAPPIPVAIVEPGRTLVYAGRPDANTATGWIFHLIPGEVSTRLISRWSFEYEPRFLNRLLYNWMLEPIAAAMQRKMLLTIRDLAEKEK